MIPVRMCSCLFLVSAIALTQPSPVARTHPETQSKIIETYGKLPLNFEANQGQTDARVKFLSRGSGYTLFLTGDEAVFSIRGSNPKHDALNIKQPVGAEPKTPGAVLRMKLVKANRAAKVTVTDELPGKSNYFIGNDPKKWRSNVPEYAKVKYEGIYSGIDLVYYGNQRQLEYDFVIQPGADPHRIQFDIRGAKSISRNKDGELVLQMVDGEVRWHKPVAYQEKGGERQEIEGKYVITHGRRVGFEVAGYDPKRSLTIDPALGYSTYLGGSDYDQGLGIAVDNSGNAYVTGRTNSTDFPTMNPLKTVGGGGDAFVTEINSTGSAMIYSTYLGGSNDDGAQGIAVDSSGNAYITGSTGSPDFPTTPGALQTTCGGGCSSGTTDAFVTEINPSGSALVYSTYLGGSVTDIGSGIAVDPSGNAYVTGYTVSPDFPVMNPLQAAYGGGAADAFVAELNPSGSALVYSTFLGGNSDDYGFGIAADSSGNAYVTGYTTSTDFFTTPGAFQTVCSGGTNCNLGDAFIARLNSTGSALVYSTYLGGSGAEHGLGIAVDGSGNAYITGYTTSTDFPTTAGAFQMVCGGGGNCNLDDAFVTKLNPAGSALVYSTYLGGSGDDVGQGIATDSSGNAYVTGYTASSDFPTLNPLQPANAGGSDDAFIAKLNATGSALVYSTYLGGSAYDAGRGIAMDSSGNAYVTGATASTDFPTMNPLQLTYGGGSYDSFVSKLSPAPFLTLSSPAVNFGDQTVGSSSASQNVTLTNTGDAALSISSIVPTGDFSQNNSCPVGGSLAAGSNCMISVTFTPSAEGKRNGVVTITDNAPGNPQSVLLAGVGIGPLVTLLPTGLSFGNQAVGIASASQTSTLTNTGNGPLTITSIGVTGVNIGDFAQTNDCGTAVPAGGSCNISVTFIPTAIGSRSAAVNLADNAPNSPQSVSLGGMGTPPIVTLSPSSLTFGPQTVSTTSGPQFIQLSASSYLSINSIATSAEFTQTNNCGTSLPAGGSCQIGVTFTPNASGLQNGTLTISDGGAGSPQSVALSGSGAPGVNVLNRNYNTMHTSMNTQETTLTVANVSPATFGKRFAYVVDGQIYAQPLFVSQITFNKAVHNVVYVATENDSVYAFDADSALHNPNPLWKVNFLSPTSTTIPCAEDNKACNVYPVLGITATPVISLTTNTIYVVARTKDTTSKGVINYTEKLHALDLSAGTEKPGSPVTICSATAGHGCTFAGQTARMVPQTTYSRAGLLTITPAGLPNGVVMLPLGTWVLAYDAVSLQLLASWNTNSGGIWGAGGALTASTDGSLYLVSGDGPYDANTGGSKYGDSVVKLNFTTNANGSGYHFLVADSFTPEDQACRYANDQDLASGGLMLLPPQPGAAPNMLIAGGKGFDNHTYCDPAGGPVYRVNRDQMGKFAGELQTLNGPGDGYFSQPAFWQSANSSYVYLSGVVRSDSSTLSYIGDSLRAYSIGSDGSFSATSTSATPTIFLTGSSPAVSSNGTQNGIVWTIERQDHLWTKPGARAAVLHAYDATNVSTELYNSSKRGTRDKAAPAIKFQVPTVANGKVYVGTQTELDVYGLCPCPER